MNKKRHLSYALTIILSLLYIFFANKAATQNMVEFSTTSTIVPYKATVTKVLNLKYHEIAYQGFQTEDELILFEAKFTQGYRKGTTFTAIQTIDSMYAIDQKVVAPGDKIIVAENFNLSAPDVPFMFMEFVRFDFLLIMAIAFCALILFFGRSKGVNTLVSLSFTIAAVFFVLMPAILNNKNIYLWTVSVSVFIILMTLFIISGISRKSFAAIIGCTSGVAIAGLLTILADKFIYLTGLLNSDTMFLLFLNPENPIDLKAIVFASIVIGSIGAIMDVSMSLSSALSEMKEQAPDMTAAQITKSGLVIGRDIMGTMANTLILAYIGSSLAVTLLLSAQNSSGLLLFNTEMIVIEILQALAGSFGILLTIPLTSIICGFLYADNTGKVENNLPEQN